MRLDVVVLCDQMWRLGFLRWSDASAVRRGLVSVRLLEVARLLRMLQLHRAQVARSGAFLVRFRAITLHLLHLSLHLGLRLSLVHALAHQYVHQQDLLLAWRDGCVLLNFLLTRMTLDLQVLASWQNTTHLAGLLLAKGAVHVVARLLHLGVLRGRGAMLRALCAIPFPHAASIWPCCRNCQILRIVDLSTRGLAVVEGTSVRVEVLSVP